MNTIPGSPAIATSSPAHRATPVLKPATTVSVMLCTYRRPRDLARCIDALSRQTRLPDEVVVVRRDVDEETRAYLGGPLPGNLNIRVAEVRAPGLVAARNAGLDACRGEILALIDDDTVPYPWWCERLLQHFQAYPKLGGLGGRDRCSYNGTDFDDRKMAPVGRLQWVGRRIGNHHIGSGGLRAVDMLKGANMSYRAAAVRQLRFDSRLRGSGAQPYEDIAFSLAVRRAGWQLMYDPDVLVDHYEGAREEVRYYSATIPVADAEGFRNFAYNGVVAMWEEFSPPRRAAFLMWSALVGTRVCPGLVQAFRLTRKMGPASWKRFRLAQAGMFAATRDFLTGRLPSPPKQPLPQETTGTAVRPLSLVFYDVYDPLDKTNWAGTAAHIIHSFERAGHHVRVVGRHVPFLRRSFLWIWYHYYLWFQKKYYHPDRDVFWTWVYSKIGSFKLGRLRGVDAVISCSPAFTAYLDTPHPVFLLHDSTWGQIVETYPHFSRTNQPKRIVDGGFKLDKVAFNKPGVHVVMTSRWAADRAIADYGAPPEKFTILPFGANFSEDPPLAVVEAGMAERGQGVCQLLFVGRDWQRKGGPLAVAITERLGTLGVPAVLHVIGCNPPGMPECVKTYGLLSKDNPEHMDFLKKMYAGSDFFLMPTRAEAQGIVFNESAAYGLPVVSTDVGGVSTVVQPDWGLLLSPETGPEEYASWIQQTFLDRAKYQALARRARQDYEERLSASVYIDKLSQVIRREGRR